MGHFDDVTLRLYGKECSAGNNIYYAYEYFQPWIKPDGCEHHINFSRIKRILEYYGNIPHIELEDIVQSTF